MATTAAAKAVATAKNFMLKADLLTKVIREGVGCSEGIVDCVSE